MPKESYYQGDEGSKGKPPLEPEKVSEQTAVPAADPALEPKENEPITRKELQSLMEQVKKDTEEAVLRKTQSMNDKLGSRLDARIKVALDEANKAIEMSKAAGVELTEAQKRAISDAAVREAYTSNSPLPSGEVVESKKDNSVAQMVNAEVEKIMKETGVYLSPQEALFIIGKDKTPLEFIAAFKAECDKRSTKPPPGNRLPTQVAGSGGSDNASVLMQQYKAEVAQVLAGKHPTVRRGNVDQMTKLKRKYMDKGLAIY